MGKKEEKEYKLRGHINNQLKYCDTYTRDASLKKLIKALDILGITHEDPIQIENEDEYHDTLDRFLFNRKESIRLRRQNGTICYTWKRRISSAEDFLPLGCDEVENGVIPGEELKSLLMFVREEYGRNLSLQYLLEVINCRQEIKIQSYMGDYTLCFDKYSFYSRIKNIRSDDFYEIEIEFDGKLLPQDDLQIKQYIGVLQDLFDYTSERLSKLEKGVRWLQNPIPEQNKVFTLFDIVKYSKQSPLHQRVMISDFSNYIKDELTKNDLFEDCLKIPTGDGMILALDSAHNILPVLIAIYKRLRSYNLPLPENDQICFRTAVHHGPIFEYQDINGNLNYAGDGINMATRVLSKSEDWQILVSDDFYRYYVRLGGAKDDFFKKPDIIVKHGLIIPVWNYHNRQHAIGRP